MAKQIVALDIDGVLADWVGEALPRLNKILEKNLDLETHVNFDLHKSFGVSKKKMNDAIDKIYDDLSISSLSPIPLSQESIRKLSKMYDFVAITARPKKFEKETRGWLKEHFGDLIVLHFGSGSGNPVGGEDHAHDKITLCKKLNCMYLVEDNPAEVLGLLDSPTQPLCHAWPWNSQLENHPKVVRGNWDKLTSYLLSKQ